MTVKEKIKKACDEKSITITKMLRLADIQSGDFYQALNGKRLFFPSWKKRISEVLEKTEEYLFGEV